jgi:serine/threonine protein kinase
MQGLGESNEVAPLERSKVYTATGDAILRKEFKDPLLGQLLEDKYRIEEVIGWGGMSVVYRARHVLVDRIVAIKTVKFRADERPDIWQRFQREIVTLSRLSHPNVVTVYDCVVGKDGQPYVVMDLIQGYTLDDVLQEKGRLPLRQLCSIGAQVASAVDHAHRHDVIHRDLKPANIMILGEQILTEQNPEVKVVDFGLAKLGEDNQRLTQTGQLWGSPPYISPEQIKGGQLDHRCDIYSLGVVVYEMATGRDPFYSEVVYEMLHNHLHNDPPSFSEMCPDDPPPRELEAVIRKAMAKDPNARYQTMAEFRDDLESACAIAESRQSAHGAKHAQVRDTAARATTGRLTPLSARPVSNPLRQASAPGGLARARSISPANIAYIGITLAFLFIAAVIGFRGYNLRNDAAAAPVVAAAGKMESQNQSSKPPEPARSEVSAPLTGASLSVPQTKPLPVKVSSHPAAAAPGFTAAAPAHHQFHNAAHNNPEEHSQLRHPALATAAHHPLINSQPVKKSPPNASTLHVDQSKFQLLRDLKSPILRQECGDLPQR